MKQSTDTTTTTDKDGTKKKKKSSVVHLRKSKKPPMVTYNLLRRDLKNKERRVQKNAVWQAACHEVRRLYGAGGDQLTDISRRVRKFVV